MEVQRFPKLQSKLDFTQITDPVSLDYRIANSN